MSNTLFIVNPVAGGKRGLRRWKAFEKNLQKRRFQFDVGLTVCRGHAQQLATSAVRSGVSSIVAFGGDGTLNEVLNGFMLVPDHFRMSARLGFVPAGSSNDFLRSIENSPGSLVDGEPITLDVGKIECRDYGGAPIERHFLVNASMGVLPQALEFFNRQTLGNRILKRISLDLTVIASGLSAMRRHKTAVYKLRFDGGATLEGQYTNLAVLRGIWFGGGMSYGSEGKPDPGLFSVVVINDQSISQRAMIMPRFYTGTILKHPAVWKRTCSELQVVSDSEGIVEADGELVGFLPARFTVLANSLKMVVWKEQV